MNTNIINALEKIGDDWMSNHYLYQSIAAKWPQINDYTHVQFVDRRTYYLYQPLPPVAAISFDRLPKEPYGWKQWRKSFFTLNSLDDPSQRLTYQDQIANSILNFPGLIRDTFNGKLRRQRKQYDAAYMRIATTDVPSRITIQLEQIGYSIYAPLELNQRYYGSIWCAYRPENDTLYILYSEKR